MVSKYFELKTKENSFDENINNLISELKDKKVVIFGAGDDFVRLNKKYKFNEKLNITAISDKKFNKIENFISMKAIPPEKIAEEDFDTILVIEENSTQTKKYLLNELGIKGKEIKIIFDETIKDEALNLNYLYKFHFDKTLPKLVKKLKNKKVMFYGAGAYLELIKKYFDISGLNIIGIADKRFCNHKDDEEFLGYKVYSPDKIKDINPDYVVVATKMYVSIIEDLYYNTLKDTKIKIKPLVKKDFFTLLKEI